MAYARGAVRLIPQTAIYLAVALAVAFTVGVIVFVGLLGPTPVPERSIDRGELSPALVQSGRDWQLQREQQSVAGPLIRDGREWQLQREQQSGGASD